MTEQQSRRLGVSGPIVVVDGGAGAIEAAFDYAGIRELYGAGWGERLTLKRLPACAVTTPQRSECQEIEAVQATNNPVTSTVSTQVTLSGAAPMVFAITADESSEEGDYKATDLKASGSWTAGDSSGAFSYSNPLRLPPAEGPLPEVSLDYSSQVVDGRMAGANNQASWVGDGWEYAPGFIERSYVTCTDDRDAVDGTDPNNKDKKTYDQCWKGDSHNVTVSLNGTNASLIRDDSSGTWRVQNDSNWRIRLEGAAATSGTATTERWTITTPDGTRYFFASEVTSANSRWTIPVFGNHDGEKCHATAFKDSSCKQAWRWLLDKAVDVHGNTVRYYYESETGYYGAADDKDNRQSFHRGGHLKRIEYGLHADHPSVAATGRVVFDVADRCLATECHKDGKPVKANWPDVPWDKYCDAAPCTDKLAPVFFTTKRLTKITTQVRNGSDFSDVESWALTHEFKAPKVAGSASLWLKEIVHAGHVGGTVTEPAVQFTGVELSNRANVLAGAPLFSRWRIQNIRTESGADIHVTYSEPDCDYNDVPAAPENNARLCFPVYWTPDGYASPKLDWFRKYVVTEISEIDRTADQPAITTSYDYSTTGGGTSTLWGYDDSEFTKKKHRTYGQWRGYSQVVTKVGEPGQGVPLTTRKRFYRGLHDQPLPGGGRRDVQVSDSEGNTFTDHPALAGVPLEEATLDNSTLVEASTTQYWTRQTAERDHDGGTARAYLSGPSVQKSRKLLAPNKWARTESRTTYTSEGLPETVSDLGDTASTGDETCTRTTYVSNDTAWIRAAVSQVETVAKACGSTISRPDDVVSDVRTYHDGSDTHGATPSAGLVTREDTLDTWNGGPVYATTSRTSYDDLGRVESVTDARGGVTTTAYTPAGPGPVTQTVTLNPLQHKVTTYQQPAWAEPTAVLDANNKRTDLLHDPLGRLTKVWLPGRAKATQTPNLEFGYLVRADGPLAVTTKRLGPNGNYITEIGLFDSLYRPVQTQEDALDGRRLVSSTGYNDRGLEAYQAGPAYVTGQPGTGLLELNPGADRVRTVFSHDAVGRVINEGLWSGDSQLWATVTGYGGNPDGWQVTVTPPLGGTATATISDVHDRTIELRQFHGRTPTGGFDTTTYSYTPRDDLKTVTGPTGKVWQYEYDLRGRERRTTDPDKGVTTLTYDNSDDVTSSTDARGEVVSTEYDLLGRQYKRLVNGQLAAEWTYDTVAKGHLTKQLSIVDGYHFTRQIFDYNDAYQVRDEESVVPAMPGLAGAAGTYVSTFTFKVDGSPERVNMPRVGGLEREMLNHTYDDLGNVTRLVGTSSPSGAVNVYVDDATYSPYGELLQRKLGVNNKPQAYQTYVYDDVTRRLAEFYFDRDASITNVAALNYKYDPAGNVLSMANRPQDNDGNARPGDSDVQCFQYDQLRRLTQAWTQSTNTCAANPQSSDVGGVSPYWKSYAYDKAGSRESVTDKRTGVTSTYGYAASGGQPHAVRTVTTGERVDHYDWDAIGNLTYRRVGGVTETLDWNAQGKLSEITGPDGTTRMHYDVDGNRIARIDPNGDATVFVAGHELTVSGQNKTATRYYEHAGGVIASRSGSSASGSGDVFWLGSDHQGSTRWVVNAVTRVDTIKYADPHGNVRGAAGGPWPSGQRGFVGGTDDPTGLTLLGARFYDSTLGAFISVDPLQDLADPQQWNGYSYSNNNPVTWSDPSGLIYSDFIDAVNQDAAQGNGKASQRGLCLDGSAWACSQKYQQNRSYAKSRIAKGPGPSAKKQMAGALLCTAIVLCRIAETAYTATRAYKSCIAGASAECGGYAMDLASMGHGSSLRRLLRNTCRHSFDPETLVLMSDGSKKPIGLIEEGDEVVAHDPETGDTAAASIEAIHVNPDSDLTDLTIRTADGRSIVLETTHHHPFWSESRQGWVDAAYLWPGEQLGTRHGHAEVVKVLNYSGNETMRDLTVANIHTYYVLAGNTPVLVHNTGPGGCIPGYENPGHHDPRGGPNPYNPNKGVLPADAEAQFQNSVLVEGTRWTKIGSGKKAIYYRYSNDEHGNWHWSGSSNGVDNRGNPVEIPLNHIPIQVRRR
ncbi:polymorphic toxin-type HINT domain-containing protein [Micromonospora andamanensis]|uniref:polymorphic toxin-type HINT domain-containing protein n=1 Tax=Micromonospora andamanensis TaxID=1287068 RepID=UPI0019518AF6|nr:polymorphic toxin-type HINT domain-containing protein [Micromonospora andamanensis]